MADMAAGYVAAGFRCVKTHIGAPGERDRDLARCDAIRRAIGPDVGYMIDINTAFDRQTALERGREFAQFDPFWYEEPLSPLDWQGHAWLRQELPLKIATGENLYTTHGFEPLLSGHGCDYAMPDILRCGGLEQTRQICQAAARQGIVPSPHNYSSGVGLAATLHLMAALPETQLLEFDPTETAIYEELFVEPLVVARGEVRVPTGPGLGVRLTDAVVQKYAAT
jgi:L-alanine-DL-glutamate epimerase-like enolase superfamily enzyme